MGSSLIVSVGTVRSARLDPREDATRPVPPPKRLPLPPTLGKQLGPIPAKFTHTQHTDAKKIQMNETAIQNVKNGLEKM